MNMDVIKNPVMFVVLLFVIFYFLGFFLRFSLVIFHKTKWESLGFVCLQILSKSLLKVCLLSILVGLIAIWIPTLLGLLPESVLHVLLVYLSTFSFAVFISGVQGWFFLLGFRLMGSPVIRETFLEAETKIVTNSRQVIVIFICFVLLLSGLIDLLIRYLFSS